MSRSERLPESLTGVIPTRRRLAFGTHPAAAALQVVATFGYRELVGATLQATRLTREEGAELAALINQLHVNGAAGLTSKERTRYEHLVGKAAGNPSLFAARRREVAAREKLIQLTEEARMAALPQQQKCEEPGAVVLPAHAFTWLLSSREASWTIADLGMLAVVRGMFANGNAELINGARFETDASGEAVLVTAEDIVIRPDANPHAMQGGAGHVNPAVALATLARNKLITVERADGGGFRITLGASSLHRA